MSSVKWLAYERAEAVRSAKNSSILLSRVLSPREKVDRLGQCIAVLA